jgi:hypothetical protein
MERSVLDDAVALLEKANANLEPELLTADAARELMAAYARAENLATYGKAVLARKIGDATEIARLAGTSLGKAKQTVETGTALRDTVEVRTAFQAGDISLDQAAEIARAEQARPGSSEELLSVAAREPFHVLKDKARRVRLEAEQGRDLASRQHAARCARSHRDELGMITLHLCLEPHVGTPIVSRAEAEAARLARKARKEGRSEPFERHLAMPTRPCCRAPRSRAGPAVPSSWCS